MSGPIISVVTPVYKTELSMLKRAYKSLTEQTLGYDKIHWIVVIHNSGAEYAASVREMFSDVENLTIEELEDGGHGPSTPRNRGIGLADTEYVAFLDSDDWFEPDCFEKALRHAKKTDADIVVFRRSYTLESKKLRPVTEVVLWDQLREEIVITKDNWREEKMFSGVWGMVTSRIWRRDFLNEYSIRFRKEVPFGEDFMFNVEAYHHAETICYLPQLIGYHYFINSSSLVQSGKKDADTLIRYAKGYKLLFDKALEYGIYMNPTISRLCVVLSRFIVGCEDMTNEKLDEIRELVGGYIEMTTPVTPNKVFSEAMTQEMYDFPRMVILHPEEGDKIDEDDILITQDAFTNDSDPSRRMLQHILEINSRTDFGRHYRFASMMTVSAYRSRVPVTTYDDYYPLMRLRMEIGEKNILTAEEPMYYVVKAGYIGAPKRFYCTKEQLEPYIMAYTEAAMGEKSFILPDMPEDVNEYNDHVMENSIMGIVTLKAFAGNKELRKYFVGPWELMLGGSSQSLIYITLLFALVDKEFSQILMGNTRSIYESFRHMEQNWEIICDDIETGNLRGLALSGLDKESIKAIRKNFVANPERADELREIFAGGFDEPVAGKIWPNLKRTVGIGIGEYMIYTIHIRKYTGNIPHSEMGYYRDEAFMGFPAGGGRFKLDVEHTFFEFVPVAGGENAKEEYGTILTNELREGANYIPVITTCSGLYRYKTKDVIKFLYMDDGAPVVSYEYDIDTTVKGNGWELNEREMFNSIRYLSDEIDFRFADYAYEYDEDKNEVVFYLELHDEDDIEGVNAEKCAELLDAKLRKSNKGYDRQREEERLSRLRVAFLEPETQLLYADIIRYRQGLAFSQIAPVRYMDTPMKESFFKAHVVQ